MTKALKITFIAAMCIMVASAMAFAGPNCGAKKTAETASADKSCSASKNVDAKMVSGDKKACSATGKTVAAADCDPSECKDWAKMAAKYDGSEVRMISVKGMTCGGCESSVKASLTKLDGVHEVAKVCHKGEVAVVIVDPATAQDEVLTTTVTNKGYEAQIMPAVATTGTDSGVKKASDKKACDKPCDSKKETKESGSTAH